MMPCGHPLATRRVIIRDGLLVTDCWACAVQGDVVSKIVGPKAAAKRREAVA